MPLEQEWLDEVRIDESLVERHADTLRGRRSLEHDSELDWLLRAVTLIDLTSLAGDDTEATVRELAGKARRPISDELIKLAGVEDRSIHVAAVCVYHAFVETAVEA